MGYKQKISSKSIQDEKYRIQVSVLQILFVKQQIMHYKVRGGERRCEAFQLPVQTQTFI